MSSRIETWNARHAVATLGEPAWVLQAHAHLLPTHGQALDLACGLGANALWLAGRGLTVQAWDFAPVAIARLEAEAAERGLEVQGEVRDVLARPPAAASFDVIVVSHFLDRSLFPALIDALRPGGLLFYQTFTVERPEGSGPSNPDFLLQPGELLHLGRALRLVAYREDGGFGDPRQGLRGVAAWVGVRA